MEDKRRSAASAGAEIGDLDLGAGRKFGQQSVKIVHVARGPSRYEKDNVTLLKPSPVGRSPGVDMHDRHARGLHQAVPLCNRERKGNPLAGDPQPATPDTAFRHEAACNPLRRVRGNAETNPLSGIDDGGVDANHATPRIDKRSTGVAGIECRVGLNEVFYESSR